MPAEKDEPLHLDVIDLGEHTGAPPRIETTAASPVEPLSPDTVNHAAGDAKLELEGGWAQERAAKVAGATAPSPLVARVIAENRAARRHNAGLTFAIILVLAVAGAGVFLYIKATEQPSEAPVTTPDKTKSVTPSSTPKRGSSTPHETPDRKPSPPATDQPLVNQLPDRGIAIRIIGAHGTPITIDGAAAGKSPVSLKRRSSTREMVIGANGKQWKIVPDHDQTIDISQ